MGEISFTLQESMVQYDMKKIGQTIDMLVIEIDQQKYEEYLFSRSVNLTKIWCYHCVSTKTHESANEEFSVNQGSLESIVTKLLYEENSLTTRGRSATLPAKEGQNSRFTKIHI